MQAWRIAVLSALVSGVAMAVGTPAGHCGTLASSGTPTSQAATPTFSLPAGSTPTASSPIYAQQVSVNATPALKLLASASGPASSVALALDASKSNAGTRSKTSGLPLPQTTSGVPRPSGKMGGLKVLDWAGFKSAITYTFDDALPSQIANYPQLHATGVNMTFFLTCSRYDATWAQIAKDGNELGNHTFHHCHADGTGCGAAWAGSIEAEYDQCSTYIEQKYGVENVWTTASPFGDTGYDDVARTRFFLNRGVWPGQIAPNDNSDPYNLVIFGAAAGDTVAKFNSYVDSSHTAGKWQIFLFHSMGGDNGYAPVDPAEVLGSINHAKSLGDVWIDSLVNVGAYWAGEKAVSVAVTTTSGSAMMVKWSLPAHFPPGKYVRVTVTGGALKQAGRELPWNDAGFYEVALDPGSLTITP